MPVGPRLLLLIAFILLPLLGVQCWSSYERVDATYESELKSKQQYAEAIRTTLVNHVRDLWSLQLVVGTQVLGVDGDHEALDDLLDKLARAFSPGTTLAWASPQGSILATSSPGMYGHQVSDRHYFRKIIEGAEAVVSDGLVGRSSNAPIVVLARGIRSEGGELLGVVISGLEVQDFAYRFPRGRLALSDAFGVVDSTGKVLFRVTGEGFDASTVFARLPPNSPILTALLENRTILARGSLTGLGDGARMGAAVPVPEFGWAVFVSSDARTVLAGARHQTRMELGTIAAVTLVGLTGAFFVVQGLTRPLRQLEQVAAALAVGDTSVRSQVGGSDEVAALAASFDAMAESLHATENQRLRSIRMIAHELRNPLTVIKGMVQLIRSSVRCDVGPGAYDTLFEAVNEETERLSRLVKEMTEVFRFYHELNEKPVIVEPLRLKELISQVMAPLLLAATHEFRVDSDLRGPVHIAGDRHRLELALKNILENATKYSPEGTTVTVHLATEDDSAVITVTDEGRGIPPDELDRIFEMAYRVQQASQPDPGGSGIGLYLTRQIVHAHGGDIEAASDGENGSRFCVRLPRALVDS